MYCMYCITGRLCYSRSSIENVQLFSVVCVSEVAAQCPGHGMACQEIDEISDTALIISKER